MANDNQKKPSSLPEGLSSIADDEVITEINLTDFLEESSKSSPLFEGFHEDIEKTEKSLEKRSGKPAENNFIHQCRRKQSYC